MVKTTINKRRMRQGEMIFREGEPGDVAYIIETGRVGICAGEDLSIEFAELGPGALFGEMAVLDEAPRTATAIAREATELTVISRAQISQRLEEADPILRLLVQVMLERFRGTLRRVQGSMTGDPDATPIRTQSQEVMDKIRLEADLKDAVEDGSLEVNFQPLLSSESGRWAGFEALVRWNHPVMGPISTERFIGLAEETNLIRPIGAQVLMRASKALESFQAIRKLRGESELSLFMGVNVSGRQVSDPGFPTLLDAIPPHCAQHMKLEITETLVIDFAVVRYWIKECHSRGYQVALDDFGTGYAGFQSLLELDFDTVKVDQAFVRTIGTQDRSRQLVQGIAGLARSLGLSVVAEGVEDEEQMKMLSELGVNYLQGYWIGKPMALEAATKALGNGA